MPLARVAPRPQLQVSRAPGKGPALRRRREAQTDSLLVEWPGRAPAGAEASSHIQHWKGARRAVMTVPGDANRQLRKRRKIDAEAGQVSGSATGRAVKVPERPPRADTTAMLLGARRTSVVAMYLRAAPEVRAWNGKRYSGPYEKWLSARPGGATRFWLGETNICL